MAEETVEDSARMRLYNNQLETFWKATDKNLLMDFALPESTLTQDCVLGIDEAGRGPVLGPMVYACAIGPISEEKVLKEYGFADSKTLTEEQRESLFSAINCEPLCNSVGYFVHSISPHYLSTCMLDTPKHNLNAISMESAVGLVQRALELGVQLRRIKVDTVGKADAYRDKLKLIFPDLEVIVESKADLNHPIVSAASICAKVTRDRLLRGWHYRELVEFPHSKCGSGYPAEPQTKAYLRNVIDSVFGFPQLVRMSWSTAQQLMDKECVQLRWPDDDNGQQQQGGGRKRKSTVLESPDQGSATANSSSMLRRFVQQQQPAFFEQHHLYRVSTL